MSTMNVLDSVGATVAVEKPLSPGQALMAASRPVVIALDQSAVPVSGTVTANAGSGTMAVSIASLPVLAAGGNVIGGVTQSGTWTVGVSGSVAVTGTFWQATQPISVASLPLPTGAATAANQATANTSLATIATAAADTTTPSPVKIDQTTPGTTDAVTIKTPADVISFTPTLDTAIYASGDVLFSTAAITGVTRANDLRAILSSLTVIDKSKQAPAFTLLFYQTNVTSAAANAANALSDADQINCLGFVNIAAADYLTFANNSVLCYSGAKAPNLMLEAATGTTTVYVVGILQAGTPTFAVGDLVLKLGLVQS